jgi:NADH dehydrogenase/NADH:ubiquinone oxidoreductase subunit G
MRPKRCFAVMVAGLLFAAPLCGQKEKREPLTEAQIEQIREAGIDPNARVALYIKFLDEHAETIKGLSGRVRSTERSRRLQDELENFTALMDELGSNLDVYSERKADIRKALKPLSTATERWLTVLRALPEDPASELAHKEAIESGEDLAEQAKQLEDEQTAYFKLHKDEQGQDRAEPK